jgi:hypothetical protein
MENVNKVPEVTRPCNCICEYKAVPKQGHEIITEQLITSIGVDAKNPPVRKEPEDSTFIYVGSAFLILILLLTWWCLKSPETDELESEDSDRKRPFTHEDY